MYQRLDNWEDKLKQCLAALGRPSSREMCEAAEAGDREQIENLKNQGGILTSYVFDAAMISGNLELVEWLWNEGCPRAGELVNLAAVRGDFEMVQWLWNKGCEVSSCDFMGAACRGHIETMEVLWDLGYRPDDRNTTLREAVGRGQIATVEWLIAKNFPGTENAITFAAYGKRFDMVKWLWSRGYPCKRDDLDSPWCPQTIRDWIDANPRD